MANPYKVEITSCSHDSSGTVGYAEGKIDGQEFVAFWAAWQPLGALFFDTWLDTSPAQNRAIVRALTDKHVIPEVTM